MDNSHNNKNPNSIEENTINNHCLLVMDNVDELIDMQINLCENLILDFNLIHCITVLLNQNDQGLQNFIQKIVGLLKSKNTKDLDQSKEHITKTMKLIIYLFTVILNLSNEVMILHIFNSDIYNQLLALLKRVKKKESSRALATIILHVFMEDYQTKFSLVKNDKIKELYSYYFEIFSKEYNIPFEKISDKSKIKFFDDLLLLSKKIDIFVFKDSNEIAQEQQLSQSMIEVLFSNELLYHCKESNVYVHDFMNNIIKTNMENTKKLYGDQYTTLYRKDNFSTEIVKHLFMCLGNYCYIKSFVTPFTNYIEAIKQKTKEGVLTNTEFMLFDQRVFSNFIEDMLIQLEESLPLFIRVTLKMVYINVNKIFKIDKNNYAPLFTALVFNYFLSPKIQDIYGIHTKTYPNLTNINRLIRNVGYNKSFLDKDEYHNYNKIIPSLHQKFNQLIEKTVVLCNEKELLNEYISKNTFKLPEFLFLWNSSKLIEAMKMQVSVFETDPRESNDLIIIEKDYFI